MASSWLLRGGVMTVVHVLARVLLGVAVIHSPLHSTTWKTVVVAVVVLIALLWGGVDGIADARANPDPDDYQDLTVRWLKAGVFAGVVAGVVSWAIGTFWFAGIGQANFAVELFAGGSFTALLIFVPAFVGAAVGRFLVRRDQRKNEPDTSDWSVHEARTEEISAS
ncbi:hypothetical protein GYA93_15565 [Gordonia desulfuricans]|uniref:B-4DMT family transporter n=1 Tax=Gordonia desulfuricans TaxID=89051 RepID=A0A7K3LRZ4_9ACTN|nr:MULTISPECIES: B-4DMT family transporter [Gordonia]EMP11305.2 hypothetical protein ISGA_5195 [Gordonia sp. NB41Y]NDK90990.1 hypothetical protein [Gordonia desulfuricans]WLP91013.1 B-4DMT family transporter [Gordonia sp. NB41Y]